MNKSAAPASNRHPGESLASEDGALDGPDDAELVARAQAGDHGAYDKLVTRHRGRIFAMIRNMIRQEADAWDLSQDVFIKAWKALPRFEAKAQFSTWLFRIAANTVYDFTRRRKIEQVGEMNDEIFSRDRIDPASMTTPSSSTAPDESMQHGELAEKIRGALAKLSDDHRAVVVLKDVQGFAYKEISSQLEISIGTVMSRLFYARQKLQSLLQDEYDAR